MAEAPVNIGSSSSLPIQRVLNSQKNEDWKRASLNYYINFRYTSGSNLRSDRARKLINYDLANGIVTHSDVQKICDPLGTGSATFSDQFMHQDKISGPVHLLLGEESAKPDNCLVFSEAPDDINRKQKAQQQKLVSILQAQLQAEIDPKSVDPNNPPPTPESVLKAEKQSPSDTIESKANRVLKVLKKRLNTKWWFNQGFKDALIAGEEIYWTGILNGEPILRKCNPLNMTIILDDSDVFVDDAIAVVEERLLTIPSILDEYGDELTKKDLDKLDTYSRGTFGSFNTAGGFEPSFTIVDGKVAMNGITPTTNYQGNNVNNYALRVARVEWMSMKKVGTLKYTDVQTGENVEKLVDETFQPMLKDFIDLYPDAEVEWFWINEAWEGIRIANDIYIGIRAKPNQRRKMDNPYYCALGYTGFLYEATNSRSVSLVDRLKSYQYLYDIISYKLQLVFASDIGKILVMDLAQIPKSEGIGIEEWFYYMKEMKVAFINSFEEGRKGASMGKTSHFNQFSQVDLSLANSVQQYINYLQMIEQQIYTVSGVNPQRLGEIKQEEAVGNVQAATAQSAMITAYLFDAHNEVKRRVYTALIEVAKLAWKKGMVTQYVNDDMALEILQLEEYEFENSEFSVFVSNLNKDIAIKAKLDQLAQVAMEQQKADLSTMIDVVINDSPNDIIYKLKQAEANFYQRQEQTQKATQDHEKQLAQAQQDHEKSVEEYQSSEKQKDRDTRVYIADTTNQTKITTTEMTALGFDKAPVEDIIGAGKLALDQEEVNKKHFLEQQKLEHEKSKHKDSMDLEKKKLETKNKEVEVKKQDTKTKAVAEDNKVKLQKKIADNANKIKEKEIKAKIQISKNKPTIKKK
jgi:hypothetical protein